MKKYSLIQWQYPTIWIFFAFRSFRSCWQQIRLAQIHFACKCKAFAEIPCKKIVLCCLSFTAFSFLLFAEPSAVITLPTNAFQGDFKSVRFYYSKNFFAETFILNSNGKKISKATAFSSGKKNEKIAVLSISTFAKADNYTIKAYISAENKIILEKEAPFTVKPVEYEKETLYLDAKNTAIKSDTSKERQMQIEKLNAILFNSNEKALRILTKFQSPVESKRLTAHFGDRRIYVYSSGGTAENAHYGHDFGVPTGTKVHSCADGRVVMAEMRNSTGWSIVVEHFPGVYSLYYHLSELKCKTGDNVKMGQLIGLSGATGLATGPHLHWEIRVNGEAVCPDFFLERGIGNN